MVLLTDALRNLTGKHKDLVEKAKRQAENMLKNNEAAKRAANPGGKSTD